MGLSESLDMPVIREGHVAMTGEQKQQMRANVEVAFEEVIRALCLDSYSPHLMGTPERMARMYVDEIFAGLYTDPPKVTTFPASDIDTGMVFLGNIDIFSTCSHHFKSFSGKAHIAYIPGDRLVGISKLARIAHWYAARPQVQETLTNQIADFLITALDARGVGVSIEAVHNCIRVRGAKQSESVMYTTSLRGNFLENKTISDEFQMMITRSTK